MHRKVLLWGIAFAIVAVLLGAFGAHALKDILLPESLAIYQTASHYLSIHALAMIAYEIWNRPVIRPVIRPAIQQWPGIAFMVGCVIFSGSLFALSITGIKILGAITPIGGLSLMAGWVGFAYQAYRQDSKS